MNLEAYTIMDEIEKIIASDDVVIFMKGSKELPQCGFSATVVNVFKKINVDFKTIDILENNELREAIKDFSSWPTIPQIYIKGEFIGGCDILKEVFLNGELLKILEIKKIPYNIASI